MSNVLIPFDDSDKVILLDKDAVGRLLELIAYQRPGTEIDWDVETGQVNNQLSGWLICGADCSVVVENRDVEVAYLVTTPFNEYYFKLGGKDTPLFLKGGVLHWLAVMD